MTVGFCGEAHNGEPRMHTGKKTIIAYKKTVNRGSDDQLMSQITHLCGKAIGRTLAKLGWISRHPALASVEQDGGYLFTATVSFVRQAARSFKESAFEKQFGDIERKFFSGGKARGWYMAKPTTKRPKKESIKCFGGAVAIDIPKNWEAFFANIYDRDDQIREVMESIVTARDTNMEVRNHLLLFGPPGCGKSDTGLAVWRMLGHKAVRRLDATATTKAGAENLLLEMDEIPPVLILEELEKCNEANLPWLLGVLDDRGEIIKTNARIGSVRRTAKCLVIATVNNITRFTAFQEGALCDRFNVPLYFAMPDRDLLKRILLREVKRIPGGKVEWVEPALDYALEVEKTYKARRIKAIMTNAKDRLLDGTYQEGRLRMMNQRAEDQKNLVKYGIQGSA